jgi:Regulator of chromosome condensation (RCC1) repeat
MRSLRLLPLALAVLLAACGDTLVDHTNTGVRDSVDSAVCGDNQVLCGGVCKSQDVTDPAYVCGTSCTPCSGGAPAGSAVTCTPTGVGGHDGVCGFSCAAGLLKTATGCAAPALVASGGEFSCAATAVADGGEVHCWGANAQGQLGPGAIGVFRPVSAKVQSASLAGVTALAAGPTHACAAAGGNVYCWGSGWDGATSSATPVEVPELAGATSLGAGANHTCGIAAGGVLKCVGTGLNGGTPSAPLGGAVLDIAAGDSFSCALVNVAGTPTVKCWGNNAFGQLGDGGVNASTATPRTVTGVTGTILHLAAGARHACVGTNGALPVWCWGDNSSHQVGIATGAILGPTNYTKANKDVTRIAAGALGTCIVELDPAEITSCWSSDPLVAGGSAPVGEQNHITFGDPPGAISAGGSHACLIEAAASPNRLRCFGHNENGQLGDGTNTNPLAGSGQLVIDR